MSTWDDARASLRLQFALETDNADEVVLTLPVHDGQTVRAQRVVIQSYRAWDHQMVEIRSAFGELGPDEAVDLLAENLKLPFGAVAVHGRFLVLVHKTPLDLLSDGALAFLLTRLGELADVLEQRRGGDRF
jgi:hypothetical protein